MVHGLSAQCHVVVVQRAVKDGAMMEPGTWWRITNVKVVGQSRHLIVICIHAQVNEKLQ